ncbi:MAG: secretin and TonB N-terminal domain-containing protein, partial [Syntrophales bacterium]|nr:secretin and TonB N-terminal domain-containing protein [Syntrophales bacterium]
MRTYLRAYGRLLLGGFLISLLVVGVVGAATVVFTAGGSAGYLENILTESTGVKERVTIVAQNLTAINVERRPGNILAVVADNLFIPDQLRKPHKPSHGGNVLSVTPAQTSTAGTPKAEIFIALKQMVPYLVRQEGQHVIVEFNVTSGATTGADAPGTAVETPKKVNGDTLVTINLQDSTVKEALELLNLLRPDVSLVSTDDVDLKGKITLHLKNVTWSRALDTILKLKGLGKVEDGQIVIISTLKKLKDDEADLYKAEEERKKREEKIREEEQKKKSEEGGLRQVSIEAKIVEVSETFGRSLGIQWAYGSSNTVFSGNYPLGVIAGTNTAGIMTNNAVTTLSTGVALTKGALAVNFPAAFAPTVGIVTGSAYSVFSAQLSALEKTARAKLVSAPRVTPMDGESANIEQGEQIPVVTPATANNPAST